MFMLITCREEKSSEAYLSGNAQLVFQCTRYILHTVTSVGLGVCMSDSIKSACEKDIELILSARPIECNLK